MDKINFFSATGLLQRENNESEDHKEHVSGLRDGNNYLPLPPFLHTPIPPLESEAVPWY